MAFTKKTAPLRRFSAVDPHHRLTFRHYSLTVGKSWCFAQTLLRDVWTAISWIWLAIICVIQDRWKSSVILSFSFVARCFVFVGRSPCRTCTRRLSRSLRQIDQGSWYCSRILRSNAQSLSQKPFCLCQSLWNKQSQWALQCLVWVFTSTSEFRYRLSLPWFHACDH